MIKSKNAFLGCVVLPALIGLGGCCGGGNQWGASQTSYQVRQYAIVPVFPFREDFFVGDIYQAPSGAADAVPAPAPVNGNSFPVIGLHIDTLKPMAALNTYYAARPMFPKTPAEGAVAEVPKDSIFGPSPIATTRLRIVAFPTFASARTTVGGLSGFVPIESVATISAAAGFQASDSASISVPVAESYGLPTEVFINQVMNKNQLTDAMGKSYFEHFASSQEKTENKMYLRVITEVFYARSIDLSIESSSAAGFSGVAKLIQPTVAVPKTVVPPTGTPPVAPTGTPPTTTPASSTTDPAAKASSLVDQLNNQMASGPADTSAPNVSFKFISASVQSVSLRAKFDYPVAIGFRGLLVTVTKDGVFDILGPVQGDGGSVVKQPTSTTKE